MFLFATTQVRYAATEIVPAKSARARGAYLRVSFKNTRETAQAINGWKLQRAVKFLENVKEKSEAVPMRRYCGSIGRTAQGTMPPDPAIANFPAAVIEVHFGNGMERSQWQELGMGRHLKTLASLSESCMGTIDESTNTTHANETEADGSDKQARLGVCPVPAGP